MAHAQKWRLDGFPDNIPKHMWTLDLSTEEALTLARVLEFIGGQGKHRARIDSILRALSVVRDDQPKDQPIWPEKMYLGYVGYPKVDADDPKAIKMLLMVYDTPDPKPLAVDDMPTVRTRSIIVEE